MPQVDFDALITARSGEGGDDLKISCKTLDEEEYSSEDEDIPGGFQYYDIVHPDDPPESFWVSKDAEYDWIDRNAFYERKDSTRGNSNSTNLNPHIKPTANSSNHNSQRFSANLKSKASMIRLPKTQKATFVDSSCRRTCKSSTHAIRLFPKRTASATVAVTEPGSPKVSCTGRVRSKRGRRRSNSSKRIDKPVEKMSRACSSHEKPAEESKTGVGKKEKKKKKTGFYSKVMSIFRSKKTSQKPSRSYSRKVVEKPAAVEALRKSASIKAAPEPPCLGGMKRFASGRQSGSWLAEDLNQVYPEPLDFDRRVCITGRR